MSSLPVLVLLSYFFPAFLIPMAGMWRRSAAHWLALAGAAGAFACALAGLRLVLTEGELRYAMGGWAPPIGIEFVLDELSAFLAVLVTGVGLTVLVYARRSILAESEERFVLVHALAMLLLAGLVGMVLTGDLFNLYVFLEISSISTYALVSVGGKRAPVAAFRYLVLGSIGGTFYVLGVGFLYFASGTLNMADFAARLPELIGSRAVVAGATLMITGIALKMALFPLHLWLPDAYNHAASAVTALIAPISTKVAAYALIRLFLDVFQPAYLRDVLPVTTVIGWLAMVGILYAAVMAIAQSDVRRMLAYSSVGQIAYVGLGIGLASPLGLIGALLHMINHAAMKGCLFLVAGSARMRTQRSDVASFTGLGRAMPWTMGAFTVAALSMIGIPPMAGFFSKWYLVLAGVEARNWVFVTAICISSLASAIYFFRLLERIYAQASPADTAEEGGAPEVAGEAPWSMLAPTLVMAAAVILLGLFNALIVREVLERAVSPLAAAKP